MAEANNIPVVGQVELEIPSNGGIGVPEPQIEVEATIIDDGLTEAEAVLEQSGVQIPTLLSSQSGGEELVYHVAANVGNDIEVDGVETIEEAEKDDQPAKKKKDLGEAKKKSTKGPKKAANASRKVPAAPASLVPATETPESNFEMKVGSQQWDSAMVNVQIKNIDGNFDISNIWPAGKRTISLFGAFFRASLHLMYLQSISLF